MLEAATGRALIKILKEVNRIGGVALRKTEPNHVGAHA